MSAWAPNWAARIDDFPNETTCDRIDIKIIKEICINSNLSLTYFGIRFPHSKKIINHCNKADADDTQNTLPICQENALLLNTG